MALTPFFFMTNHAEDFCGYTADLYKKDFWEDGAGDTMDYFDYAGGKVDPWTFNFETTPCDIASSPIHLLVSERFKTIAEHFETNAEFHPMEVVVQGKPLAAKHYLVRPPLVDAVDTSSPELTIKDHSNGPNWISGIDEFRTSFYRSKLEGYHWVMQERSFYTTWIVSEAFKNAIQAEKLSNFRFDELKLVEDKQ